MRRGSAVLITVLTAVAAMVGGCARSKHDDEVSAFYAAVNKRGVDLHAVIGPDGNLGDAVCADLRSGSAGANVVQSVADGGLSVPQAEIVTYWAITELCSDQMQQRQNHWRDGE